MNKEKKTYSAQISNILEWKLENNYVIKFIGDADEKLIVTDSPIYFGEDY